ncbi:phytanoyl-CoA dioxygenase family protein [Paenibacillus montanisoli]|uniref:Phytanoyl-CoA dioxygenase family protein n=1 Tax=Paenibacillus montanisoli TaxID=2081970 RepID=A0A328U6S3_9BACL|nr:phytanoyl-CoA dioxygenase family protein [Paenibacillus montanisoli]RAP78417.1 hypothetical protein DL346_08330 [Paenibacillus montanisoli]
MNGNTMAKEKYEQLMRDGYCVFEQILDEPLLEQLRDKTNDLLDRQSEELTRSLRNMGSDIPVEVDPFFAELIAWPKALEALASLGFPKARFRSGYIISKPPHSPRLFWHHDFSEWTAPDGFGPLPQMVFLMYYLVDTTPFNGCLRAIPGSHVNDNPLHDELLQTADAHSAHMRSTLDLDQPAFSFRPDEVDVPVKAGDLLIGDSRLLHAAHANQSDVRRTVITLWYHLDVEALSETVQAAYAKYNMKLSEGWQKWPEEAKKKVEPLFAVYEGTAEPLMGSRKRPKRGYGNRT